jgi:hypothetical protein
MSGLPQFKITLNGAILSVLLIAVFTPEGTAQSQQALTFYGHTLGESAEAFFQKATMADSVETFFSKAKTANSAMLTRDYCRKLVDDPDAVKRYEASRTDPNKKDFLLSDLPDART